MAKIQLKKLDGLIIEHEAETIGDCRKFLGLGSQYVGSINGDPADDQDELEDFHFVSFAEAVKGGIA